MERKISLTEQVGNLELANKALRNYVQKLQEQLAMYERLMQCCPKLGAQAAIPTTIGPTRKRKTKTGWTNGWKKRKNGWKMRIFNPL